MATVANVKKISRTGRMIVITIIKRIIITIIVGVTITEDSVILSSAVGSLVKTGIIAAIETSTTTDPGMFGIV